MNKMNNPSPIKEAAILFEGKIYTGRRHGGILQDILQDMVKNGFKKRVYSEQQGFITEEGEFLSRKNAYHRAVQCGQIVAHEGDTECLVSEDLY